MADLTEVTQSPTLKAMEGYWKDREAKNMWIRNLGASNIGEECERKIWFTYRYVLIPEFESRLLRLFQRGHAEEETFIKELKYAGVTVYGAQESIYGHKKHFVCHPDGKAIGILEAPKTEHILEFKTMSDKSFKKMYREGCEKAQPKHFAQMQIQMHLTGITRAFYLTVNKNTDELYAERIRYDKTLGERLYDKAKRVIDSPQPLERCESYQCRWCDFRTLCMPEKFDDARCKPELNCRTCVFVTPVEGGEWKCDKFPQKPIPKEFQLQGCTKHLLIPGIIDEAVTESDGETYVEYESGLLNFNDEFEAKGDKEYVETLTHGVEF